MTDLDIIEDSISYWLGEPNNPLNGKTFKEILELTKKYGKENIR